MLKITANVLSTAKKIKKIRTCGEDAIKDTLKDYKKRAPAWVAAAVTKEYNIKKADVTAKLKKKDTSGTFKISGRSIDNVSLIYEGESQTLVHFGAKAARKGVSAKVFKKGKRFTLTKAAFMAKTGGEKEESIKEIPFMRKGEKTRPTKGSYAKMFYKRGDRKGDPYLRQPIMPFRRLAVPQMITVNENVGKDISKAITENLGKRLTHYAERELQKIN
jgi:hypothetical protein